MTAKKPGSIKKPVPSIKFPPGDVKILKNTTEIGKYIQEDKNSINDLVKSESLPAWKRNGKGPWRALTVDLDNWLIAQRNKFLARRIEDADAELG